MAVSSVTSSTSSYQAAATATDTASQVTSTVSATSKNKVYDKMDANKDGKVSYQEEITYRQNHPEAAQTNQSQAQQESSDIKSLVGTLIDTTA